MTTALDDIRNQKDPIIKFGLLSFNKIYIQLSSKSDPEGKCICSFHIKWDPHFCCGKVAPMINLEAQEIKFVAMYPEILSVFLEMQHSSISMEEVLEGLAKIGTRIDLSHPRDLMSTLCNVQVDKEVKEGPIATRKQKYPINSRLYAEDDFRTPTGKRYYVQSTPHSATHIDCTEITPTDLRQLADYLDIVHLQCDLSNLEGDLTSLMHKIKLSKNRTIFNEELDLLSQKFDSSIAKKESNDLFKLNPLVLDLERNIRETFRTAMG